MSKIAPVLPGETLAGKYRVERVLGRGGMGIVVAARHLELDERVAIKFLIGEREGAATERFLREARSAAKIKGEHVCRVFDFGRTETGEPYIVMEHLEGTDLATVLERDGAQKVEPVVGWIVETCDALAEAHALGIIHRDLKPANVFLANRPDGTSLAKVLDFGISKLPFGETVTGPEVKMGSPLYMSPEQIESARDVDARSDVWSLGVVLYELLTGKPPFVGDSMLQLSVTIREKEPTPLGELAPDVPEPLAEVVAKCLAKRPADRWPSVAALAVALRPFAPPEVNALLSRLERRVTGAALDATLPAPPKTTPRDDSPLARARGTFAPLQSTLGDALPSATTTSRRGRVAGSVFALGLVAAAIGVYGVRVSRSTAGVDAATAPLEERSAASAPWVPPAAPSTTPSATITARSIELPSPPPARSTTPTPRVVVPAPSDTALVSAAPSAALPPATRKRRELDREDP